MTSRRPAAACLMFVLLVAGCSSDKPSSTASPTARSTTTDSSSTGIELTKLPLGKTVSEPTIGGLWACRTDPGAGGAQTAGPWIDESANTWDATKKISVTGSKTWSHSFAISTAGGTRHITGNGLPDHATGVFPVRTIDPAYNYDRNPNIITEQKDDLELPANPTQAASPVCAGGEVGIMISGVRLFSAIDAPGRDAVAYEVQDRCGGHPELTGRYHYHALSPCIDDLGSGHSKLVGYAFDGFGIYGYRGEDGQELTNANLDVCHGHTHEIMWDGERVTMYHYHATHEYPYTVGCMRAASAVQLGGGTRTGAPTGPQGGAPPPPGPGGPPPPPPR